jgi:hypothetical protein
MTAPALFTSISVKLKYSKIIKNAFFWDMAAATCSLWFLARGFFYPEDGGDTFLRNVGSHKKYTAPHSRK